MGLAVRSLQVGVRLTRRPAVSGTCELDHVKVAFPNLAIEVNVDEVLAGSSTPMPQKPGLAVFQKQRFAQQRIGEQINPSN